MNDIPDGELVNFNETIMIGNYYIKETTSTLY